MPGLPRVLSALLSAQPSLRLCESLAHIYGYIQLLPFFIPPSPEFWAVASCRPDVYLLLIGAGERRAVHFDRLAVVIEGDADFVTDVIILVIHFHSSEFAPLPWGRVNTFPHDVHLYFCTLPPLAG